MSDTQSRLDAYKAAELRILQAGFSVRLSERHRQEAELSEIRKAIRELEGQLAAEQGGHSSRGSLRHRTAVFNR